MARAQRRGCGRGAAAGAAAVASIGPVAVENIRLDIAEASGTKKTRSQVVIPGCAVA